MRNEKNGVTAGGKCRRPAAGSARLPVPPHRGLTAPGTMERCCPIGRGRAGQRGRAEPRPRGGGGQQGTHRERVSAGAAPAAPPPARTRTTTSAAACMAGWRWRLPGPPPRRSCRPLTGIAHSPLGTAAPPLHKMAAGPGPREAARAGPAPLGWAWRRSGLAALWNRWFSSLNH